MSVLIKGIEMPKCCSTCNLRVMAIGLDFRCAISGETVDNYYFSRHPKCPIVKVPTPHGRLIEAERLFNIFEPITSFPKDEQIMYVEAFLTAIKQAQTIIEAEVNE